MMKFPGEKNIKKEEEDNSKFWNDTNSQINNKQDLKNKKKTTTSLKTNIFQAGPAKAAAAPELNRNRSNVCWSMKCHLSQGLPTTYH